jgi:hypothetical protein
VIEIRNTFSAWSERHPVAPGFAGPDRALHHGSAPPIPAISSSWWMPDSAADAVAASTPERSCPDGVGRAELHSVRRCSHLPARHAEVSVAGRLTVKVIAIQSDRRAFRALIARVATC